MDHKLAIKPTEETGRHVLMEIDNESLLSYPYEEEDTQIWTEITEHFSSFKAGINIIPLPCGIWFHWGFQVKFDLEIIYIGYSKYGQIKMNILYAWSSSVTRPSMGLINFK